MPRQYTGKHSFTTVERKQKNGSIYVYQKESWYDPTVKYTRYKLTLLGYKDSDTGQIHETRPRKAEREVSSPVSVELDDNAMIAIIEHISEISGVTAEVLESAPNDKGLTSKILTLAWYSFATDGSNWTGAENWTKEFLTLMPYNHNPITENIYQDMFKQLGIDSDIKWSIFKKRAQQYGKGELLAWDSSTYPCGVKRMTDAQKGKHKDGLFYDMVKVLYIYSLTSRQLIAYVKLPGPLADVSTVLYGLNQLRALELNDVEVVSDNGYYSDNNIGEFLHHKQHFIIRMKAGHYLVKDIVDKYYDSLGSGQSPCKIIECAPEYCGIKETISHKFPYTRVNGSKKKNIQAGETDYIEGKIKVFVYYSSFLKGIEDRKHRETYANIKSDIEHGRYLTEDDKKFADKYMIIKEENGNTEIVARKRENDKAFKYHGFLVLIADKERDCNKALMKYRLREKEEENIKGHKSHTGGDTSKTGGDEFFEGELLVEFLGNSLRESFATRIRSIEESLAMPNGDRKHDLVENLKEEKALLNWLRKKSFVNVLGAYKTTEIITIQEGQGKKYKLSKPIIGRNLLFLNKLGINIDL